MTYVPPRTPDGRAISAVNSIPPGYTVYPTGEGSDITNGTYQGGGELLFDKDSGAVDFQFLDHYYGLGGIANWEDCSVADYVESEIIAPATQGLVTSGDLDYVLSAVTGGNIIVPVTAGTGTHDLDLTATLNANVSILSCSPVPVSTPNTGYFDYDPDTNTITRNEAGSGEYNLFDFDVHMLEACWKCWGIKNGQTPLIAGNVVGKRMFNFYKVRFKFTTAATDSRKMAVIISMAVKLS